VNQINEQIRTMTEALTAELSVRGATMSTIWHCIEYHDDYFPVWFMVRELEDWRWVCIAQAEQQFTEPGGEAVFQIIRHMEGSIDLWPAEDHNVVALHRLIDGAETPFEYGVSLDGVGSNHDDNSKRWRKSLQLLHERAE
jgi:hypothetical protein